MFDFLNDILRLPKFNHFIILADAKKEPFEKVQGTKTTAGLLLMTCRGRLWQLNRPQREVDKPLRSLLLLLVNQRVRAMMVVGVLVDKYKRYL